MTWKRMIESVIFLFSVLALVYLVIPGTLNEKNSMVAGVIDPILQYLDEILPSSPKLASLIAGPSPTPAAPEAATTMARIAAEQGVPLTRIGHIVADPGLRWRSGTEVRDLRLRGYDHFA